MSNFVAERTHSNILNNLRTYISAVKDTDKQKLLPEALAAIRAGISTCSSEFSPFYLCFVKEMNFPIQNILSPLPYASPSVPGCVEHINKSIALTRKLATDNIKRQQEIYKTQCDKNIVYPSFGTSPRTKNLTQLSDAKHLAKVQRSELHHGRT